MTCYEDLAKLHTNSTNLHARYNLQHTPPHQ